LRLVGFPGVAEIDPTQPIFLTNSLGKTLTASYDLDNILIDPAVPIIKVGLFHSHNCHSIKSLSGKVFNRAQNLS
jgi:hypothetical protein